MPLKFYQDREKTETFHVELLINEFSKVNWNVKIGYSYIEFGNTMALSKKVFYLTTIERRDFKNILWKELCSIYECFGAEEFGFSYWILESSIIYEQYVKLKRKEKKAIYNYLKNLSYIHDEVMGIEIAINRKKRMFQIVIIITDYWLYGDLATVSYNILPVFLLLRIIEEGIKNNQ